MLPVTTLNKLMNLLFSGIFIAVLSLSLLNELTSDSDRIHLTEKRKAAELPVPEANIESLSTYPGRFESFYKDNFGFRAELIYLHNYIKVFMFGLSPSARVVTGKDGWLFYNSTQDGNPIADYRNLALFSADRLARKADQLIKRNNWLKKQGIKYLYVIVPNKGSVYPEHMPDYFNRVGKFSLVDQFIAYIRNNSSISIIDLRPALIESKRSMPVYARTGSHWNDFGAYVASNAILKQLNTWFPEIEPLELANNSFSTRLLPGADLALMLGLEKTLTEQTIVGPARESDCRDSRPIEAPRFTVYWGPSFVLDCNGSDYKALVFRDSFTKKLVPYLSDRFSHITYVWTRPNDKSFTWFVNKHQPDVVMEIHVERYLRTYP